MGQACFSKLREGLQLSEVYSQDADAEQRCEAVGGESVRFGLDWVVFGQED